MTARRLKQSDSDGTPAWRRPDRVFALFTSGMNSLGTFWVFCLMFLICADVVARLAFDAPIRGVAEIVGYSIVTAVFLQFAHTLHVGRFTRADILIEWLEKHRPVAGHAFVLLFYLLGICVFAAITYGTYPKFAEAWTENEITGVPGDFTFVIWPFLGIIVAGAAATTVEFAIQSVKTVGGLARTLRTRSPGDKPGWMAMVLFAAFVVVAYAITTGELTNV